MAKRPTPPTPPTPPLTLTEQAFNYIKKIVHMRVRAVNRARANLEGTMTTSGLDRVTQAHTGPSGGAVGAYERAEEHLMKFIAEINDTSTSNTGYQFLYPPQVGRRRVRQQTFELRGVEVELVRNTHLFKRDHRIDAVIVRGLIRQMGGDHMHDYSSKSSHQ